LGICTLLIEMQWCRNSEVSNFTEIIKVVFERCIICEQYGVKLCCAKITWMKMRVLRKISQFVTCYTITHLRKCLLMALDCSLLYYCWFLILGTFVRVKLETKSPSLAKLRFISSLLILYTFFRWRNGSSMRNARLFENFRFQRTELRIRSRRRPCEPGQQVLCLLRRAVHMV